MWKHDRFNMNSGTQVYSLQSLRYLVGCETAANFDVNCATHLIEGDGTCWGGGCADAT